MVASDAFQCAKTLTPVLVMGESSRSILAAVEIPAASPATRSKV